MRQFEVQFKGAPPLLCQLDDTELAERYYQLLQTQYTEDPNPIFRDPQRYSLEYFADLCQHCKSLLGWNWHRDSYDLDTTVRLHKDLEAYLAQGYQNISAEQDNLLHELHFALHAIEAGCQRSSWLQIEWYNDQGFPISADEYPAKKTLNFGDLRLQNPYVGHHPQFVYQQRDQSNILQTCRFHDFCKPGINLVIEHGGDDYFDWQHYLEFFRQHAKDFLSLHGESKLRKFTGHPIVGRILNLKDFETVLQKPFLEFKELAF